MRFLLVAIALLASTSTARAGELFVTTTNYQITGSTSRVTMDPPWTTELDEYVIHSDAVVRTDGRYIYILNRFGADNVLVLDAAANFEVVTQYSVAGEGRNPHDIEVVGPGRAYLSLYESTELLILDPLTGQSLGSVDLAIFADDDGLPEVDQLERLGDRLFVTVQRRARQSGWVPAGGSGIAVIDLTTDTLVDADPDTAPVDMIELGIENPFWRFGFDPRRQRLLVACSGDFLALDGGLVEVNPFSLQVEGVLIDESTLGGDLLDFALVTPTLGYALISELDFDTKILRFDPSTGSVGPTLLSTSGFHLSDLELDATGRLYVGDRRPSAPGVRVFDAATGQAVAGPIGVGLPPFDLLPVDFVVTGAPEPRVASALRAWPNPFNPRVQLEMTAASGPAPALEIFDARGRRMASLTGDREAGRWQWSWNGSSHDGSEAPSGTYFARVGDQRRPIRLVR